MNNPLENIPERYLHDDVEPSFAGTHPEQLPVVSLDSLIQGDLTEFAKFHHACTQWGFFQLVSHGVSHELIERFKLESKAFFELPMEEKKKYWQTPDDPEGFGQRFVVASEDQKLNWYYAFSLTVLPLQLRRPHLLPLLPLPFRETLESYTTEVKQLATKIFNCMAEDLKNVREDLRGLFDDGKQSIKIAYYPPCPQNDKVIGLLPHSDPSALTILQQLNEVDGLEIRKDGRWLPVQPLPNAFIVNIGDFLEIVSNGIYKSVEHRAKVDPKTERLSAASFFNAIPDAEVGPAQGLVTPDAPPRFRRIRTSEYLKGYFAQRLNGKSYLDTLRINIK